VPSLHGEEELPLRRVHGDVDVVEKSDLAERVDGRGVPAVGRLVGLGEGADDRLVAGALHLTEVGVEAAAARHEDDHGHHDDGEERHERMSERQPQPQTALHCCSSANA
jgi:hypothetical protein